MSDIKEKRCFNPSCKKLLIDDEKIPLCPRCRRSGMTLIKKNGGRVLQIAPFIVTVVKSQLDRKNSKF